MLSKTKTEETSAWTLCGRISGCFCYMLWCMCATHLCHGGFSLQLFQRTSHHFGCKENFWCPLLSDSPSLITTNKTKAHNKSQYSDHSVHACKLKLLIIILWDLPYICQAPQCPLVWGHGLGLAFCQSIQREGFSAADCDSHQDHLRRTAHSGMQHCNQTHTKFNYIQSHEHKVTYW